MSRGLRFITSWSRKMHTWNVPSDHARGCQRWHATTHSSTRSPSPTFAWWRLLTAFLLVASLRSFTYANLAAGAAAASALSAPASAGFSSSIATDARPPKGANTNFSPFSDQDAGKPRSTRLPLTSLAYASWTFLSTPPRSALHSSARDGSSHRMTKWTGWPGDPPVALLARVRLKSPAACRISWSRAPPSPASLWSTSRP
mmetsp:Transcript_120480/g.341382  ORF Transcript_120480/g.341382 Transcript_120480/m.341382 type:complete len:201 (-) Transcript_120480:1124-1726(-)